jgi:hypothetical protein
MREVIEFGDDNMLVPIRHEHSNSVMLGVPGTGVEDLHVELVEGGDEGQTVVLSTWDLTDGRRTLVAMTVPFDGAVIQEFRRDCIAAGAAIGPFKDNQLARVLEHVLVNGGDAEIAAQALAAKPRPAWVTEKLAG